MHNHDHDSQLKKISIMATLEDTETHKKQVVRFSTILPLPVGRQNDKIILSTCTPRNLN